MLVSLQHVIEGNSREIEKLKKESAELWYLLFVYINKKKYSSPSLSLFLFKSLHIKNIVNRHHESLDHFLDNLSTYKKDIITKERKYMVLQTRSVYIAIYLIYNFFIYSQNFIGYIEYFCERVL